MEVFEAIRIRRNVHRYKKESVPVEKITRILEAGLQASSAMNGQPWEFIVVRDPDQIEKLAQFKYDQSMQGHIASDTPREEAERMSGGQRDAFANTCPVAVIYDRKSRLPVESCWCCITTIWLAACAEGLAASPSFYAVPAQAPLREILGVPDTHDIAVVLRIGVPEAIPPAKPRKALSECLSYNRYGAGQ